MQSNKRLPRAVREQQMLDAAVRVFAQLGFHGANMDEIAELSGVSKPMVYAYLGTKEELFLAGIRRESQTLLTSLAAAVEPGLTPDEQLWRGLKGFFGYVGEHRDGWRVIYRRARSQQPFAAEVSALRRNVLDAISKRISSMIENAAVGLDGDGQGRQPGPEDVTTMAVSLVGASESLADWLVEHPESDPEAAASCLMNLVWMGAERLIGGQPWHPVD